MEMLTTIPVHKTAHSRIREVDFNSLEFGKYISDHMLVCDYNNNEWQEPQIVPYADFTINPAALALHYGQTVFEGMKAFRTKDGRINIFRIKKHYERFVKSLERMCMAVVPEEIFTEGLMQLVKLDEAWVPTERGSALYLRPFSFASEAKFGVKISEEFRFIIFTGPVPMLYSRPVTVKVETEYVRAVKGGTGAAKCGGNYGASYLPTKKAREEGYDQVLWTDGKENEYIEESGTMNVMFVIDGVLITPPLSDSILDGVTRDSLLSIARHLGINAEERPVSIAELEAALQNGTVTEAFGAGTAAIVSPISLIGIRGKNYELPAYTNNSIMNRLKTKLDNIRYGTEPDIFDWNYFI
jgi:branched-chain amino acid aminotransferase